MSGDDKLALDVLCKLFAKKSSGNNFIYIYEECEVKQMCFYDHYLTHPFGCHCLQMSDDPEEVATRLPLRTAPRIVCFNGDNPQYFLFVEDKTVLSVCSMPRAIVFWFILHY